MFNLRAHKRNSAKRRVHKLAIEYVAAAVGRWANHAKEPKNSHCSPKNRVDCSRRRSVVFRARDQVVVRNWSLVQPAVSSILLAFRLLPVFRVQMRRSLRIGEVNSPVAETCARTL